MKFWAFSPCLLCCLLLTFTEGNLAFTQMCGYLHPSGESALGSVLFETKAMSTIHCAALCKSTSLCRFVAVWSLSSDASSSVMCRGHGAVSNESTPVIMDPAVSVWTLQESAWLEKPCSNDSQCGDPPRECFAGSCLCSPGYYYSLSRDSCLSGCALEEQQSRLLTYPRRKLQHNNILALQNVSLEDCLEAFLQTQEARTCNYSFKSEGASCRLKPITPLDAAAEWKINADFTTTGKPVFEGDVDPKV